MWYTIKCIPTNNNTIPTKKLKPLGWLKPQVEHGTRILDMIWLQEFRMYRILEILDIFLI